MKTDTIESTSSHIPSIPLAFKVNRSMPNNVYRCRYVLDEIMRDERHYWRISTSGETAKIDADIALVKRIRDVSEEDIDADGKIETILNMIIEHYQVV